MRQLITDLGFLLGTSIYVRTISRKMRMICNLVSKNTSKRFIHYRKGVTVVHSVNKPTIYSSSSVCLCGRRYTSDMKNDEMVKAWMNEIKDDFEKQKSSKPDTGVSDQTTSSAKDRLASDLETEIKTNKTTNEKDSEEENMNTSASDSEKAETYVEADIHGFTTDEMIELVKRAQISQAAGDPDERAADNDDDESDSSSSDSDNDDDSSSSSSGSDSEESEEGTKNSEKASQNTEKQLHTEMSDNELGLGDSDITRAASKLKTELGKAAKKNEDIRKMVRKNRDVRSIQERFKNASDFVKSEIEDFVNIDYQEPEEEVRKWEPPVPLTRGKTGVFDIEELVTVLESARAREIVVIKIPDEIDFANYMVIVTALSYRHIKAVATDIRWIYKRKKDPRDNYIKVDGEDTKDWFAFDLGNIILHIFTAETRAKYDLETLWTVGPKFDSKCQQEVKAPVFSLRDLPWLEELEQQVASQDTVANQDSETLLKKGRISPNQESQL